MKKLFLFGLLFVSVLLFGCTGSSTEVTKLTGSGAFTNLKEIEVNSDSDYANIIGKTVNIKGRITWVNNIHCIHISDKSIFSEVGVVSLLSSEAVNKTFYEEVYPATYLHVFTGTIKRAPNPYGCFSDHYWAKDKGWYLEITSVGEGMPK